MTNRTWAHFWLNEGFTVYVERKIIGRLHGEKERHLDHIVGHNALVCSFVWILQFVLNTHKIHFDIYTHPLSLLSLSHIHIYTYTHINTPYIHIHTLVYNLPTFSLSSLSSSLFFSLILFFLIFIWIGYGCTLMRCDPLPHTTLKRM